MKDAPTHESTASMRDASCHQLMHLETSMSADSQCTSSSTTSTEADVKPAASAAERNASGSLTVARVAEASRAFRAGGSGRATTRSINVHTVSSVANSVHHAASHPAGAP